ncbi:hypothetical protein L208DRAFT_1398022 [Tricholoma matsutake]|nr:hypothetical protein L208DRAFT_1398022 [Tricholoma matsutake 945]
MKFSLTLLASVLTLGSLAHASVIERSQGQPVKNIAHFSGQLITFSTTVPVTTVLSRLDAQLNKTAGGDPTIRTIIHSSNTSQQFVAGLDQILQGRDFMYFSESDFDTWLKFYETTPRTSAYTVGNPILAQTILQYNLGGALTIPPRILILEHADHSGTSIQYQLPSSVVASNGNQNLKAALHTLDTKLENLVRNVTTV